MSMKISILGSTGSIGTQALEILEFHKLRPVALTCHANIKLMEEQARRFKPDLVCASDENASKQLKLALADTSVKVVGSDEGVLEVALHSEADTVLNSLVGIAGLLPTLTALEANKRLLLANKESLVCGGELVVNAKPDALKSIIPVDSEHSAIFQCLQAGTKSLKKIILTASGGAFRGWSKERLTEVTVEQALTHPNWSMGAKVTIDSALLMNKGFELIEAMWLFGVPPENIEVVVHPQSIIHSFIEYDDNAVLAQLGVPDMKIPIQYAMFYPQRLPCPTKSINLAEMGNLSFEKPDTDTFTCLTTAYKVAKMRGNAGAALNAASEATVSAFVNRKISFLRIPELIDCAVDWISNISKPTISDIIETDRAVKAYINSKI